MPNTEEVPTLVVSCLGVWLWTLWDSLDMSSDFCRDGMNGVGTTQLGNRTSQRGMISQVCHMTVHCFHGGKQYTELCRCTGEILLTVCLSHSHGVTTPSMPNIPYFHGLPFPLVCLCIYYEPWQNYHDKSICKSTSHRGSDLALRLMAAQYIQD